MAGGAAVFLPPIPGGSAGDEDFPPPIGGFSNPRLRGLFLGSDLRPLLEGLKDHLSDWRAD